MSRPSWSGSRGILVGLLVLVASLRFSKKLG